MDSTHDSQSIAQKLSLWLSSKKPPQALVTLNQKNIYIVPSRQGFAFMAILIVMLITAINYQSSLVYLLTFVLASVLFFSIWLCFLNMLGLTISAASSPENFAGEPCQFRIGFSHPSKSLFGLRASLEASAIQTFSLTSGQEVKLLLEQQACSRGWVSIKRLKIETGFPFGFIVAWSWVRLDARTVVYPQPCNPATESQLHCSSEGGDQQQGYVEPESLRALRPGEGMSRLLWKKLAAKDELVVREEPPQGYDPQWLRWDHYPDVATELRLSYLCYEVLRCSQQSQAYGLHVPGAKILPGTGPAHRKKCLQALALYGVFDGGQ